MWTAATVLTCALQLLGRSDATFPRVELIEKVPPGISPLATGYVLTAEKRIVVITSTAAFTRARRATYRCGDVEAVRDIAGVLAHEEWHLLHGGDEEEAYNAQIIALLAAGADANSSLVHKIMQVKQAVLAASGRAKETRRMARHAQ